VKLRANEPALADCLDTILAALHAENSDLGRDVAIDASDMPAFANGQRFVRKCGRERERFADPDASWGHRSAVSTRKGGGFYGYKLNMAVCTRTDLPLAWQVETARRHESLFVAPLLDKTIARGYMPETVAMDKGYSNPRVREEVRERGCVRSSRCSSGTRSRSAPSPTDLPSGLRSIVVALPWSASSDG
jgi:hypothetical protein